MDPRMHHQNATRLDDDQIEAAVLGLLLSAAPGQLTRDEIRLRMIDPDADVWRERDAVDRAMREIVAHGAAHREGEMLHASQTTIFVEARIN